MLEVSSIDDLPTPAEFKQYRQDVEICKEGRVRLIGLLKGLLQLLKIFLLSIIDFVALLGTSS